MSHPGDGFPNFLSPGLFLFPLLVKDRALKIVEFFGGPGSGKTTMAYSLFSAWKREGRTVDVCREFAQDAIHQQRSHLLDSQFLVAAGQYEKYEGFRMSGCEVLLSDSSMQLGQVYGNQRDKDLLVPFLNQLNQDYQRIKVFVKRCKPFNPYGRVHDEKQSHQLDLRIQELCGPFDLITDGNECGIEYAQKYLEIQLWPT